MNFPELGVKRYVMAFMVSFVIIVSGIAGFFMVGISENPDVDFPFITIDTELRGADAVTVDNTVTKEILDKLNGISGIEEITSTSYMGMSRIFVEFELDKDIDVAFNEVQAKVNEALNDLPSDTKTPIVQKLSNTGDAVVRLNLSGNRTVLQLNEYADNSVKKRLENISGVGSVDILGEREIELRIDLDTLKLSSYGMSIDDLVTAFQNGHYQMPAGYLVSSKNEYLLNLDLESKTEKEAQNIIIKNNNGSLVKLKDVSDVYRGLEDFRGFSFFNSEPSLSLEIQKIPGSDIFKIEEEAVHRINDELIPNLDPGLKLSIVDNSVDYVKAMVHVLEEHLILGTFITALVVLVFLRNLTSTLIISYSIPISLMGAVFVIFIAGYTLNGVTLLALLLLIGIVVDDTIIVLENIFTKMEEGIAPEKAAIVGSNQIIFAVLAATLSMVAIFGPVMFMGGIVGKFFKSFAVVVTCGTLISYVVAIYITPMMCSRYLRVSHNKDKRISNFFENIFVGLERYYVIALKFCLGHKVLVIIFATLFFLSSFFFFGHLGGEFVPSADKSKFKVTIINPAGSNTYYTIFKTREVENILRKYKEIKDFTSTSESTAVNRATIKVNLVPIEDRSISQQDFIRKIQKDFNKVVGAKVLALESTGFGNAKLEFSLVSKGDMDSLYALGTKFEEKLRNYPGIGTVDMDTELLPQIGFSPNREKIALMNLSVSDVVKSIGTSLGGLVVGKYNEKTDPKRYDVRLQSRETFFNDIPSLNNIFLSLGPDQVVRLDNLAKPYPYLGFSKVQRKSSLYQIPFKINPDMDTNSAVKIINNLSKQLPNGYSIEYTGMAKEFLKTVRLVLLVFGFAIFLLYAVLASQFNSFIQPVLLMTAVPLALTGSVFLLYITHDSLNLYSMIGIVLLVGLVVKNSILLIDFTNELRKEGKSIYESLVEASPRRLRPILMTSLTVILTMIPAVLSKGEGSESNASLSLSVIGGMVSSTILTLIVIPVVYLIVEGYLEKKSSKKENIEGAD